MKCICIKFKDEIIRDILCVYYLDIATDSNHKLKNITCEFIFDSILDTSTCYLT